MMLGGNPIGTCINWGDGICSEIENVCNCPEDCDSKNSDYETIEDFCKTYVGINTGLTSMCEEDDYSLPLCKLCTWN